MLDGYFISGTDTNVGKTIVSAILVNKFDGIYFKPIQCGLSLDGKKDSDIIKEICIKKTILEEKYFLKTPASPNIAAKMERKKIKIDDFKKIKMDELLTMSRKTGFYEMIEIMIGKLKNVGN